MNKKFIVRLSEEERETCRQVIKKLKGSSQKARRAQIQLKTDADGPGWTDSRIAEAFNCRVQTIENLRNRLVLEGFELALEGKKRPEPPVGHALCRRRGGNAGLRQSQYAHQGSIYEAFEPEQARAYCKRIKFCYTPKHGSWLCCRM